MSYDVVVVKSAERELKRLPDEVRLRVAGRLLTLADDPFPPQSKRLVNSAFYRLRLGDYRVIYSVELDANLVTILAIGHRRDIYREFG